MPYKSSMVILCEPPALKPLVYQPRSNQNMWPETTNHKIAMAHKTSIVSKVFLTIYIVPKQRYKAFFN